MNYQIVRATETDLPLMQRFFYQTVTIYGTQIFSKEEVKIYSRLALDKNHWKQKFVDDFVYNVKLNGEVIGSFSMNKNGFIEYIFVHLNYQGHGISKDLYATLETIAKENGITVLKTQVSAITQSFFEKKGFEIIAEVEKVAGGEEVVNYNGIKHL